jgi:hypothetical protein
MLNRPPTRIELKIEDDLIDLEEAIKIRLNKVKNINNILNTNINCIPSDYKSKNEENEFNFLNHQFHGNLSQDKLEALNFEFKNSKVNIMNESPNIQRGQKSISSQITRLNVISKFISEEGEEDFEDANEGSFNNSNYDKSSRITGSGVADISMR